MVDISPCDRPLVPQRFRRGFPQLAFKADKVMGWTIHEGELHSHDVQDLLELHFKHMRSISPPQACHVLPAEGLSCSDVTFWSLREDGRLLGIGGLKQLAIDHGEVKSMRTAPEALDRGVGRAMLAHILDEARARNYRRLSLETGSTRDFSAALHLYEREGFVPSGPFGGYPETPFTRFYTIQL